MARYPTTPEVMLPTRKSNTSRASIPDPTASTRLKSPAEAQKEPNRDGRPRARDAGKQGCRLGQADTDRLLEAKLVRGAGLTTHVLAHYEERANQHQVERD